MFLRRPLSTFEAWGIDSRTFLNVLRAYGGAIVSSDTSCKGRSSRPEPTDLDVFTSLTVAPGRSSFRQLVVGLATAAVRWPMSRRIRRLVLAQESPKLHLGCAYTILPEWVNVDFFGRVPADVALDVRKPLPIADSSVDAIFTEHMLEHLVYSDAVALVRECARVLRPEGVLRIVVPDFEMQARLYTDANGSVAGDSPDQIPQIVKLANIVYGHAHRSIWDSATLILVLTKVGLTAEKRRFGESRIHPCPDSKSREAESLYVEAVKVAPDREAANTGAVRALPVRRTG